MTKFLTGRPEEVASMRWAEEAAAGGTRIPLDMRPRALPVKRFPVRINHYESAILQMAADLDHLSKQQQARVAMREYCERKLRAAGIALPK